MSYWEQRRPIRRIRSVDVHSLAAISADLLDEGGMRTLTIRAAALGMGVAPASLYSRVTSVDDLFDLALDHALDREPEWRDTLEHADVQALLLAYYRHLVRHPWAPRGSMAGRRSGRITPCL